MSLTLFIVMKILPQLPHGEGLSVEKTCLLFDFLSFVKKNER